MRAIHLVYCGLLLSPAVSFSADFCESAEKLKARVNYCDENPTYVAPAKACVETFRKLVKSKNEEIDKVLKAGVAKRKGDQQAESLQTTQATLASAALTLTELLFHGKNVYNEIDNYSEDFVLPIYEAYPEDYDLDPHSKKAQQIFREKECYGEPMDDLDKLKKELLTKIKELEKTKIKVDALKLKSNVKETDLGSLSTGTASNTSGDGGSPAKDTPVGTSPKKASTITGVEEEKKKTQQK